MSTQQLKPTLDTPLKANAIAFFNSVKAWLKTNPNGSGELFWAEMTMSAVKPPAAKVADPKGGKKGDVRCCCLENDGRGGSVGKRFCCKPTQVRITDTAGEIHAICGTHARLFMSLYAAKPLTKKEEREHPTWVGVPAAREWKLHEAEKISPDRFGEVQPVLGTNCSVTKLSGKDNWSIDKSNPVEIDWDNVKLEAFEVLRTRLEAESKHDSDEATPICADIRAGRVTVAAKPSPIKRTPGSASDGSASGSAEADAPEAMDDDDEPDSVEAPEDDEMPVASASSAPVSTTVTPSTTPKASPVKLAAKLPAPASMARPAMRSIARRPN